MSFSLGNYLGIIFDLASDVELDHDQPRWTHTQPRPPSKAEHEGSSQRSSRPPSHLAHSPDVGKINS